MTQPAADALDLERILREQDGIPQKTRVGTEWIHLTSLTEFCPRLWMLTHKYDLPLNDKSPRSSERVMWRIGRAVEDHIRSQIIEAIPDQCWGDWKCQCGHHQPKGVTATQARRRKCKKCGGFALFYVEHTLYDPRVMVSGSPDLQIIDDGALRQLEIKSTANSYYTDIVRHQRPLPNHSFQVFGYRRLTYRDPSWGGPVHSSPLIIYGRKEYRWESPYAVINPNEGELQSLNIAWSQARQLKRMRRGQTNGLPPRLTACRTPDATKPAQCAGCALCFSLDS